MDQLKEPAYEAINPNGKLPGMLSLLHHQITRL